MLIRNYISIVVFAAIVALSNAATRVPFQLQARPGNHFHSVVSTGGKAVTALQVSDCMGVGLTLNITIGSSIVPILIDTTSSSLVVASTLCTDDSCYYAPALYNVSTGNATGATGTATYLSGITATGPIYKDRVLLGNLTLNGTAFLAISTAGYGFFTSSTDATCTTEIDQVVTPYAGIAGFASIPVTVAGTSVWVDAVSAASPPPTFTWFSLWSCGLTGELAFGSERDLVNQTIAWTPMLDGADNNAFTISSLSWGGFRFSSYSVATVVTSTDYITYLPLNLYEVLVYTLSRNAQWVATFGYDFFDLNQCMSNDPATVAAFDATLPRLFITLQGGATLSVSAVQAFALPLLIDGVTYYCCAIAGLTSNAEMTIGSVMMGGFLTTFDFENAAVGFSLNPGPNCVNQTSISAGGKTSTLTLAWLAILSVAVLLFSRS